MFAGISISVAFSDYLVYSRIGHSQCLSHHLPIFYNIVCFYFNSSDLYLTITPLFWEFISYLLFKSHFSACSGSVSHHPRVLTWVAQVGNSSCAWTKFPKKIRQASTCNESTMSFGHPTFESCNSSSHQLSSEAWHPASCQLSFCLSSCCRPYSMGAAGSSDFRKIGEVTMWF